MIQKRATLTVILRFRVATCFNVNGRCCDIVRTDGGVKRKKVKLEGTKGKIKGVVETGEKGKHENINC